MTRRNASKSAKIPASERPVPAWLEALAAHEAPAYTHGIAAKGWYTRAGAVGATGWFIITGSGFASYLGSSASGVFDGLVRVSDANGKREQAAAYRAMAAAHGISL